LLDRLEEPLECPDADVAVHPNRALLAHEDLARLQLTGA
jgi:hypothetical protein